MYKKMVKLLAASLGACLLLTSFAALGVSAEEELIANPSFERVDEETGETVSNISGWTFKNLPSGATGIGSTNPCPDGGDYYIDFSGIGYSGDHPRVVTYFPKTMKKETSYILSYRIAAGRTDKATISVTGGGLDYEWSAEKTLSEISEETWGSWQKTVIAFETPSEFDEEATVTLTISMRGTKPKKLSFDCIELKKASTYLGFMGSYALTAGPSGETSNELMFNIGRVANPTTNLSSKDLVTARFYSQDESAATAIIAVYNEDGDNRRKLVAVETTNITAESYGSNTDYTKTAISNRVAEIKLAVPYSTLEEGTYEAEVFVWSSIGTLIPLTDSASFTFTKAAAEETPAA